MKNVFICYTPYHVYVSLLFILNSRSLSELIITDHIEEYKKITINLKKNHNNARSYILEKINKNYTIFDFLKYKKILNNRFKISFPINNENSYMLFLDNTRLSHYIMLNAMNVSLVEDGKTLFFPNKNHFKKIIKMFLKIPLDKGESKLIKNVYTTNYKRLPNKIKYKAIEFDIEKLQNNIAFKKKKIIFDIFNVNLLEVFQNDIFLVLTGPYSETGLISELEKIKLYQKIIKRYSNNLTVYLKPHPRETTKYENYLDVSIKILNKNFPIELINLDKNIKIKRVVSIDSSALEKLKHAEEILELGINYDKKLNENFKKKYG